MTSPRCHIVPWVRHSSHRAQHQPCHALLRAHHGHICPIHHHELLFVLTASTPPTLPSMWRLCYLDTDSSFTTMASRCHDLACRMPLLLAVLDPECLTKLLHSILNPKATIIANSYSTPATCPRLYVCTVLCVCTALDLKRLILNASQLFFAPAMSSAPRRVVPDPTTMARSSGSSARAALSHAMMPSTTSPPCSRDAITMSCLI